MKLFFCFVSSNMTKDYSNRWNLMRNWLHLSFRPKSIEFNLLGFGQLNKQDQYNRTTSIKSPFILRTDFQCSNRTSYSTFVHDTTDENKNMIIVFEATTSKIYMLDDVLSCLSSKIDKYSNSIKKLMYKLCQLERQIYFLSYYYSMGLCQFFGGLILLEFYRDPSINPDTLLKKLMSIEEIRNYVPLLYRLFQMNQLIFSY